MTHPEYQGPRKIVERGGIGGMAITTHIILTICTGGCWGVVWFLHWLFTRSKRTTIIS
jgi:hypothetical protein